MRGSVTNESGHALFYALIVTPFVFGVSTVLIDLSRFRTAQEVLIEESERIAQVAASALPNQVRAQRLAQDEIAKTRTLEGEVTFPGEGTHTATVTLRREIPFTFDALFQSFGQNRLALKTEVVSAVSLVPMDTVLIVSDSGTLRPGYSVGPRGETLLEAPWGDHQDYPASSYLTECASGSRYHPTDPAAEWIRNWGDEESLRWATESCFNPALTPLKEGAIAIAQEKAGSGMNQLGLIFTPGQTGADTARPLGRSSGVPTTGGLFEGGREKVGGYWSENLDPHSLLGNRSCVLFSRGRLGDLSLPFAITTKNSGSRRCDSPAESIQCGNPYDPFTMDPSDSCYLTEELSLEELIYFRAAQLSSPTTPKLPQITQALRQGLAELLSQTSEDNGRAGLTAAVKRQIIYLTDHLPQGIAPELREVLTQLESSRVTVVIGSFSHSGMPPVEEQRLRAGEDALRALAVPNLTVVSLTSPQEIRNVLVPALSLKSRETIVRFARVL